MKASALVKLGVFALKLVTGQTRPAPTVEGLSEWKGELDEFYERVLNSDTYSVSTSPTRPVVVSYFSRKDNSLLGMVVRWPNRDFYFMASHDE